MKSWNYEAYSRPEGYDALLVDLDGTLIGKNEKVSARVSEAVGKLSRALPVSIVTGREPADVIRFARHLALSSPQICDGGAMMLDPSSGQPIWSIPLRPGHAAEIVTRLDHLNAAFIATYPGGTITSITVGARGLALLQNLTRVSAMDMAEQRADELVACFCSNPDLNVVKVFLPYNGLWAVDFTCTGVNKATAATKLAQIMGTETSQFIGAGDSYNDLPLLQVCGLRIAMGNAPAELKAIADYVAPPVEADGLAVAIEEFILPRLLERN